MFGTVDQDQLQLIAFRIAHQDFCFDIKRVREIRGWTPVTPLPRASDSLLGMINLRGTIIPVIDLASRLGFKTTAPSSRHAILVVEVANQIIGLLVEAVSEILQVNKGDIQAAPAGAACADRLVEGVISKNESIVTLLALDMIADTKNFDSSLSVTSHGYEDCSIAA